MEQHLPLPRAALEVTPRAMFFHLGDVPPHRAPTVFHPLTIFVFYFLLFPAFVLILAP